MSILIDCAQAQIICPQCNNPTDVLHRTIRIDETDVRGLLSLWAKDIDVGCCPTCGFILVGHPPIVLSLTSSGRLLRVPGQSNGSKLAPDDWGQNFGNVEEFSDLSIFRLAVRTALERNAEPLRALPAPSPDMDMLPSHWRQLTSAAFAAAAVIRVLNSNQNGFPDIASAVRTLHELVKDLGDIQGETWIRLGVEAGPRVRGGARLMEELDRVIQPSAILPGAIDRFMAQLPNALANTETDRFERYCRLAVAARAFDAAGLTNPFVAQWVSAWFAQETDGFSHHPQDESLKARTRVTHDLSKTHAARQGGAAADNASDMVVSTPKPALT